MKLAIVGILVDGTKLAKAAKVSSFDAMKQISQSNLVDAVKSAQHQVRKASSAKLAILHGF